MSSELKISNFQSEDTETIQTALVALGALAIATSSVCKNKQKFSENFPNNPKQWILQLLMGFGFLAVILVIVIVGSYAGNWTLVRVW